MKAGADAFAATLDAQPGRQALADPKKPDHGSELVWLNHVIAAPTFRRAHVEWFEITGQFAVIHVVILPHLNTALPIFGFDMMSGQQQATGMFLDFSPVTGDAPDPDLEQVVTRAVRDSFTHMRSPPSWGKVFSPHFLGIRPVGEPETQQALALGHQAMNYYLRRLQAFSPSTAPVDTEAVQGHAAYAAGQRMNPHTMRMLARYVGADQARAFIDEVLFPMPA